MSYDLHMFEPRAGEDGFDTLERLAEDEQLLPAAITRNRRIATALRELTPTLEEAASEGDATDLTEERGLLIELLGEQAMITVPYWNEQEPDELRVQLDGIVKVIAAETGWRLYDPQIGDFTDLAENPEAFHTHLTRGRRALEQLIEERERPKRSVWKRLLGR